METYRRVLAKAVCWQASGLVMMTLIGYVFTGSLSQGGTLAVSTTALGLVTYILHERLWDRIAWGRRPPAGGADHDAAPPSLSGGAGAR